MLVGNAAAAVEEAVVGVAALEVVGVLALDVVGAAATDELDELVVNAGGAGATFTGALLAAEVADADTDAEEVQGLQYALRSFSSVWSFWERDQQLASRSLSRQPTAATYQQRMTAISKELSVVLVYAAQRVVAGVVVRVRLAELCEKQAEFRKTCTHLEIGLVVGRFVPAASRDGGTNGRGGDGKGEGSKGEEFEHVDYIRRRGFGAKSDCARGAGDGMTEGGFKRATARERKRGKMKARQQTQGTAHSPSKQRRGRNGREDENQEDNSLP